MRSILRSAALAVPALLMAPALALAHHPTGGETPDTVWHGFLSGVGHPIIGLDHLAFVVAIGLIAATLLPQGRNRALLTPISFLVAAMIGCALHLVTHHLPLLFSEIMVVLSVFVVGGLLLARRSLPAAPFLGGIAVAGLFHGIAYGETIIGAEMGPVLAYLVGFTVTQYAIALAAFAAARWLMITRSVAVPLAMRTAGAVMLAVGALSGIGLALV